MPEEVLKKRKEVNFVVNWKNLPEVNACRREKRA